MAFLRNLIDWALSFFKSETLVLSDEILIPPPEKAAESEPEAPKFCWEDLFARLDVLLQIERTARVQQGGPCIGNTHKKFRRKIGPYLYFGGLDEFPGTVSFTSAIDLPAMFSVYAGLDATAFTEQRKGYLSASSVNGIMIENRHIPVERMDGSLYEASMVYSRLPRKKRWGKTTKAESFEVHAFFYVHPDGSVSMPKVQGTKQIRLLGKHFTDEAAICSDFAQSLNAFRQRDANWLVKVDGGQKKPVRATFGISPLDAPHVFNSRMKVKTATGRTRPIFHPVRTHERHHADGSVSIVGLHHRGLTKFIWRGYKCEIAIPSWKPDRVKGAAAIPMNDFTLPAFVSNDERKPTGMLDSWEVADRLMAGGKF